MQGVVRQGSRTQSAIAGTGPARCGHCQRGCRMDAVGEQAADLGSHEGRYFLLPLLLQQHGGHGAVAARGCDGIHHATERGQQILLLRMDRTPCELRSTEANNGETPAVQQWVEEGPFSLWTGRKLSCSSPGQAPRQGPTRRRPPSGEPPPSERRSARQRHGWAGWCSRCRCHRGRPSTEEDPIKRMHSFSRHPDPPTERPSRGWRTGPLWCGDSGGRE